MHRSFDFVFFFFNARQLAFILTISKLTDGLIAIKLSGIESGVSNLATECTASRGVKKINYNFTVLLSIYGFQNTPSTHKLTAKLSNPLHVQHLAQYRRVALGLHVQVGPLDCSPGLSGKGEVEAKKKKGGDDGRKAHNNSLFPCMLGPAA